MDEDGVVRPLLQGELADGFEERQPFDVAGGASDLGDEHVSVGGRRHIFDALLDFVGDVRDDLHGLAEVIAAPLFLDDIEIHAAAGEVVELGELGVGEPLVVAQVQVGFGAVVEHVNLAMLERAHGAGVHVEVGDEFLEHDLEAAPFEQGAQRSGRQALAERAYHAASDEDVFHG